MYLTPWSCLFAIRLAHGDLLYYQPISKSARLLRLFLLFFLFFIFLVALIILTTLLVLFFLFLFGFFLNNIARLAIFTIWSKIEKIREYYTLAIYGKYQQKKPKNLIKMFLTYQSSFWKQVFLVGLL